MMTLISFMQSPTGRILRIVIGVALLWYGAQDDSLLGLVLMMLGLVPVVTAVLGVCLLEEITREYRDSRARESHV